MEIPHEYLCPISHDIMNDPVICNDGYTYERNMILNILNSISPITRELINKNNLIPNQNLKDTIERYKILNGNEFNIYKFWVKTKQKMFNSLINNIKDKHYDTPYIEDNMILCKIII